MYIYPYKQGSKSVAALAAALNAKVIRLEDSKFKGSLNKIVINWGNSMTNEELQKASVLNTPEAIAFASNKLDFFETVQGSVPIPPFTINKDTAKEWLAEGRTVVVREILNGHSGAGIVLLDDMQSFDSYNHKRAKLYVQYIPKISEFRLHVVNGNVIDVQQKKKSNGAKEANYKIRNHANGFIYAREDVKLPSDDLLDIAVRAVSLCGLHFGAVDIIWNDHRKMGYVLEVNTAPGLEGQTVKNYTDAFIEMSNSAGATLIRQNSTRPRGNISTTPDDPITDHFRQFLLEPHPSQNNEVENPF